MPLHDTPARRVHMALGGLTYRLSELVSHGGMAVSGHGCVLFADRALGDIAATRELLTEMESALLAAKAGAEELAAA